MPAHKANGEVLIGFTKSEWDEFWASKTGQPSDADCRRDLNFHDGESLRFLMQRWKRGSAAVKAILGITESRLRLVSFSERSQNTAKADSDADQGASQTVLRTFSERSSDELPMVAPSSCVKSTYGRHKHRARIKEPPQKPKRKPAKASPVIDFLPVLSECQALLKAQKPSKGWKQLGNKQIQIQDLLKKPHIRRKPDRVSEVKSILKWFAHSQHDRAVWLRNGSPGSKKPKSQCAFGIATILGAEHYEEYLAFALEEDTDANIEAKAGERVHSESEQLDRQRELERLTREADNGCS